MLQVKMQKKDINTLLINASRIFRYRKDVLSVKDLNKLEETRDRLKELLRDRKSIKENSKILKEVEGLNQFLLKIGGKIYPKTFWIDNVEVGLVAIVVIIGIRAFFCQPFIIPTNSMYPTYSGMNEILYSLDTEPQTIKEKIFNKLLHGSRNHYLETSTDGRVSISLFSQAPYSKDAKLRRLGHVSYQYVEGREWFGLLPATYRQYEIFVGNQPIKLDLFF